MESNEISMFMDSKLDIHGKRPESLKFKTWTRCLVKIEAIKCVPSFLRFTLTRSPQMGDTRSISSPNGELLGEVSESPLCVSINVPGVSVSPTTSRTKQHSYGLFWKQNRRDCFIYFAIETEASYRRHMKWIKRSIKNLELHRQIFLDQRRNSRGRGCVADKELLKKLLTEQQAAKSTDLSCTTKADVVHGPLPRIPDISIANDSTWSSKHISRVSEIYEEIFENDTDLQHQLLAHPRVSRRFSSTSIASGIYEEMKPTTVNFNAIDEEVVELTPPPLPPLPPPRKRINTFDRNSAGLLGEIPRSNTNPESEMAKKTKYKNMLDNLFGGVTRSKRSESVSETSTYNADDLVKEAVYANGEVEVAAKRQKKPEKLKTPTNQQPMSNTKRNSFSSPDLSKINFLETFDEDKIASLLLQNSFASTSDDLGLSSASLDESSIHPILSNVQQRPETLTAKVKTESAESINISQQIPLNFNFSACNTSSINLVGASGATLLQTAQKNNIFIDDLTGYCLMAPIKKKPFADNVVGCQQSTSSGYSTGSYSSTTSSSSCTNSTEDNSKEVIGEKQMVFKLTTEMIGIAEESAIYENMIYGGSANLSDASANVFTGNLYENILHVKESLELATVKDEIQPKMSTSTPTGIDIIVESPRAEETEESFYQTPRKSIICVDDKVPSYYPNDCDTSKLRRHSHSPIKTTPTSSYGICEKSSSGGLRQLVSAKVRRDRKENCYVTSPQKICVQNQSPKTKTIKSKKTAAHKISEHVYAVSHNNSKKSNQSNNNIIDPQAKLENELLQLAALQNIDFTFEESNKTPEIIPTIQKEEAENCLSAKESASRILHKYATLARAAASPSSSKTAAANAVITPNHHLQQSQQSNTQGKRVATDIKIETNVVASTAEVGNGRKFASLPRFKKIDFSPLRMKLNNVLQRN